MPSQDFMTPHYNTIFQSIFNVRLHVLRNTKHKLTPSRPLSDEKHAYIWMRISGHERETEAVITIIVKEQPHIMQLQVKVLHTTTYPTRMCNAQDEIVTHNAGCMSKVS